MQISQGLLGAAVVVVVAWAVVMLSLRMILSLQIVRNSGLLKRRNGRTYGRTDLRTDLRTDGRTDRPSYRDARTHLKRYKTEKLELKKQGQQTKVACAQLIQILPKIK